MKKLYYFFLLGTFSLSAQSVTTLVNNPGTKFSDALILDNAGNLFCADYSGTSIFKMTPNGIVTTFATGFNTPNGLAFDSGGNLYMCDNQGNAIYKMDAAGTILDTFPAAFPSGIIKDLNSDTLIFTEYSSQHRLMKLAPDGNISVFHVNNGLNGPVGLAWNNNELYVGNFNNRRIYRVEQDTLVYIATVPGSGNNALGFIASANGALYGTAFTTHKIYKIFPEFTDSVVLYAGSSNGNADGPIATATFSQPNGIIASAGGDSLYITEYASGRLRLISGVTASLNQLDLPENLGTVYPNPVDRYAHVELNDDAVVSRVHIIALDGKTMEVPFSASNGSLEIDLQEVPSGYYRLEVLEENGLTSSVYRCVKL